MAGVAGGPGGRGVAPRLLPRVGVNPTVLDVKGAPVPGLSGVGPRPAVSAPRFGEVLRQLRRPARVPAGPTEPPRAAGRATPGAPAPPPARAAVAAEPDAPRGARAALAQAIRRSASAAGVEPALSVAVARAESSLDPRARSADGLSVGTFQVTWGTAAEMRRKIAAGTVARPPGTDDVALGVGYLRYLHDLFGRDARLRPGLETVAVGDAAERRLFAVAAFNAGEGRVARAQARAAAAGGDPTRFTDVRPFLPPITQRYVERVSGYRREEGSGAIRA
jgi:soluble lytic murein transglycosylase-like protein